MKLMFAGETSGPDLISKTQHYHLTEPRDSFDDRIFWCVCHTWFPWRPSQNQSQDCFPLLVEYAERDVLTKAEIWYSKSQARWNFSSMPLQKSPIFPQKRHSWCNKGDRWCIIWTLTGTGQIFTHGMSRFREGMLVHKCMLDLHPSSRRSAGLSFCWSKPSD